MFATNLGVLASKFNQAVNTRGKALLDALSVPMSKVADLTVDTLCASLEISGIDFAGARAYLLIGRWVLSSSGTVKLSFGGVTADYYHTQSFWYDYTNRGASGAVSTTGMELFWNNKSAANSFLTETLLIQGRQYEDGTDDPYQIAALTRCEAQGSSYYNGGLEVGLAKLPYSALPSSILLTASATVLNEGTNVRLFRVG